MEIASCVPNRAQRHASYPYDWVHYLERLRTITVNLHKARQPVRCSSSSTTRVFTWGSGLQAQLGHGDYTNQPLPRAIEYLTQRLPDDDSIRQCSCGSYHSGCTTDKGKLFLWGRTQDNRLGHGDNRSSADQPLPKDIASLDQLKIVKVFCGDSHTLAVTDDGRVLSWGKNTHGQCGRLNPVPATSDSNYAPITSSLFHNDLTEQSNPWIHRSQSLSFLTVGFIDGFPINTKIVDACCGKLHSMGLSDDGIVYVWGSGAEGVLGTGTEGRSRSLDHPTPIALDQSSFGGKKVIKIAAGFHFSAAVTEDGRLYTWGSDQYGQLGHGKEDRHVTKPCAVRSLWGHKVSDVSCGQYHMAAVVESGAVFTWGYGKDGQLGHGDKTDLSIPTRVEKLGKTNRSVSCGGGHTAIVDKDCSLWMMGKGKDGQLGRADNIESIVADRLEPVRVDFFKSSKMKVVMTSLGQEHSLAIVQEG